jgi:uncharacterized alpha-E superfamily protein
MISRVAEHCFWLSRYLERAENTARILEANNIHLLDMDVPLEQQWTPLLIISGIHDLKAPHDAETVQHFMTWEISNPSSIAASIAAARENGRIIREVISADMWERLNFYHLWMQSPAARTLYEQSRHEFYNQIKRINQMFQGITDGTMAHGEPYEFLQFGKYLERACQTTRILDVKYHILLPRVEQVGTPIDNAHWVAILSSCSGYEPYHKKQRVPADPSTAVAEFLIYDPHFPRSVLYCLTECQRAAHAISERPLGHGINPVEIALNDLIWWLRQSTIHDIVRAGLHETLTIVVNRIHELGSLIHQTYFDMRFEPPPTRYLKHHIASDEVS